MRWVALLLCLYSATGCSGGGSTDPGDPAEFVEDVLDDCRSVAREILTEQVREGGLPPSLYTEEHRATCARYRDVLLPHVLPEIQPDWADRRSLYHIDGLNAYLGPGAIPMAPPNYSVELLRRYRHEGVGRARLRVVIDEFSHFPERVYEVAVRERDGRWLFSRMPLNLVEPAQEAYAEIRAGYLKDLDAAAAGPGLVEPVARLAEAGPYEVLETVASERLDEDRFLKIRVTYAEPPGEVVFDAIHRATGWELVGLPEWADG